MYANIKVMDVSGFDIDVYSSWVIDKTKPYLVVRHVHGKKQAPHFHVAGVPNDVSYLKPDPPHPDSGRGKKPIQQKKEDGKNKLYDEHMFEYCLKPSEWAEELKKPNSCVICTSFTPEELHQMAEASRKYWENKKNDIAFLLESHDPEQDEAPEAYHMRLGELVMAKLHQDETDWLPNYKYKILKAMHKKGGRYKPYALKKLVM